MSPKLATHSQSTICEDYCRNGTCTCNQHSASASCSVLSAFSGDSIHRVLDVNPCSTLDRHRVDSWCTVFRQKHRIGKQGTWGMQGAAFRCVHGSCFVQWHYLFSYSIQATSSGLLPAIASVILGRSNLLTQELHIQHLKYCQVSKASKAQQT